MWKNVGVDVSYKPIFDLSHSNHDLYLHLKKGEGTHPFPFFFLDRLGAVFSTTGSSVLINDLAAIINDGCAFQAAGVVVVVAAAGVMVTLPQPGQTLVLGTTSLVRLWS